MNRTPILIIVALITVFISCTINSKKISEPSVKEIEKIVPIGNKISKELVQTLQKELKAAIKEGGLDKAIDVCNLKAVPLTDIVANSTDMKVDIKRTTMKYRNKLNAPDDTEFDALGYFENLISDNKEIPDYYLQKVNTGNETSFYYYKPMKMGKVCLTCHGNPQMMDREVLSQINELYPDDKALNYKEGDFRGLIRIKIKE
ncbi:MAG: hypothetical protein B6D61_10825 [Bacteroidetes bacterium 4484_249]|nr:MAG: hypothetical protein B6D61_10825 [Bacteroidetes bacterium 4484_249]